MFGKTNKFYATKTDHNTNKNENSTLNMSNMKSISTDFVALPRNEIDFFWLVFSPCKAGKSLPGMKNKLKKIKVYKKSV